MKSLLNLLEGKFHVGQHWQDCSIDEHIWEITEVTSPAVIGIKPSSKFAKPAQLYTGNWSTSNVQSWKLIEY